MKYNEWLKTWLELYVKTTVKIRTFEKYEQIARTRIIPSLGEFDLKDLTAEILQGYVVGLGEKLSANSINGTIVFQQSGNWLNILLFIIM